MRASVNETGQGRKVTLSRGAWGRIQIHHVQAQTDRTKERQTDHYYYYLDVKHQPIGY